MSVYRIIGPLVSEASLGGEKAALGLGRIESELSFPWQHIAPIGL